MAQPFTIILFGSAGSGKGTQGGFLISALNVVNVEAGELVRGKAKEDSPFGRHVKEVHESGRYLSDEDIALLVEEKIMSVPRDRGLLIDGYPRRLGQASRLEEMLARAGRTTVRALVIEASEEELKRRLLNRSVCVNGHILVGRKFTQCPIDGAEVVVRDYDQNIAAIMKRIRFYQEEVVPAIEYYRAKGWVVDINGEQPVAAVRDEIFQKLGIPLTNVAEPLSLNRMNEEVERWVEFAITDLEGAEVLFEHPKSHRSWQLVVYHCHQAVEKFLKAVMVKQGKEVKKTHDLTKVLEYTEVQFPKEWVDYIDELNPHYHVPRYPDLPYKGPVLHYDQSLAQYHLTKAKEFSTWIRNNQLK